MSTSDQLEYMLAVKNGDIPGIMDEADENPTISCEPASSPLIVFNPNYRPTLQAPKVPEPIKPGVMLFYGPMYGGKSRALLRHVLDHALNNYVCLVFKFNIDTRYNLIEDDPSMTTHDQHKLTPETHKNIIIKTVTCNAFQNYLSDSSTLPDLDRFSVVAIDEIQFLKGSGVLLSLIQILVDRMGKLLVLAGLNMWANGDDVAQVKEIITRVEKPKFKCSKCSQCHVNDAIRSVTRLDYECGFTQGKSRPVIKTGGKETYISICRSCYNSAVWTE